MLAASLPGCVPRNFIRNAYLEAAPDKELPVSVEVPLNWKMTPREEDKTSLTLSRRMTGEEVTITVRKMAADTITPAIMQIFCRLYLEEHVETEWKQESFSDNTLLDGLPVLEYRFNQGERARLLAFIEKDAHVYIIDAYSSVQGIALVESSVIRTVRFSTVTLPNHPPSVAAKAAPEQPKSAALPELPKPQAIEYSPPAAIFDMDLEKLLKASEKAAMDRHTEDISASEQAALLEQYLFTASLFKSEAYIGNLTMDLENIRKNLEQMPQNDSLAAPIGRCKALVDYLENNPRKGTEILEDILKSSTEDPLSAGYTALLNPYNQKYVDPLNTAYDADPGNIFLGYMQYRRRINENKTREGKDIIRELTKKNSRNTWLQFHLARIEEQDKNEEKAKKLYQKIIRKSPSYMPAKYNMALLHYKGNEYKEAESLLKSVLSIHPHDEEALLTLAETKKQLEKYEESRAILDTILTSNPYNFRALYNLGALCAGKLNDTYCARTAFSEYLIKAPHENRVKPITRWLQNHTE